MKKINLKITTPERVLLEEEIDEIVVPTRSGQITVLPDHESLISEIVPGEMIIRNQKQEKIVLIFGGFIHVQTGSKVIILADSAEHLHEVNEKEAEEARRRAEAFMREVRNDKERFADAEAELIRNLARLKVIKKYHSRRGMKLE
ncbi:ATP synthase F1 subunit epsilon [bacterium CG_4_10_14_0_2_um_filter_33_32]|nr:MAG: ATP synthase F1 subunit epsilon [bacterium CG2_30_33_46]PIZ85181.1 MAG: ATP synthase F1 subunit epsilon [bacterium CG_4_10_14_0_2_um_filter_33_32]